MKDPVEDILIVQGQLHFYRVFQSSGAIERATDNAQIQLDWHSLPDQFRMVVNRECDSPRQVQLRASMLMNDGVFGKYFTTPGDGKSP